MVSFAVNKVRMLYVKTGSETGRVGFDDEMRDEDPAGIQRDRLMAQRPLPGRKRVREVEENISVSGKYDKHKRQCTLAATVAKGKSSESTFSSEPTSMPTATGEFSTNVFLLVFTSVVCLSSLVPSLQKLRRELKNKERIILHTPLQTTAPPVSFCTCRSDGEICYNYNMWMYGRSLHTVYCISTIV